MNLDPVLRGGIEPPAQDAPSRKNERVCAVVVDDRQFSYWYR
jgi:hypothetical protein